MARKRRPIRWAFIILLMATLLVATGYYAGVLLKEEPDEVKVLAENASGEDYVEEASTMGQADTYTTQENEEKILVTTGKQSNAIQVEKDSTNILIMGQDKVSNLYDTIGIVSIDKKTKTMMLFMIPRDTYIEYTPQVVDVLEKRHISKSPGVYKINNAHNIGSMCKYEGRFKAGSASFLADVIKEKFGVVVDDYIKVNTAGFAKLVDHFKGVDINVPYLMNYDDPTQDLHIHLKKGPQHLDGSGAEGFVRFRQGFKEDGSEFQIGDIARKKNQVTFIKEFIKQKGTLANISKIPGMFDILGKNLSTSIDAGEVLTKYIGLANDIANGYEINSTVLDGEQIWINGAAYIDVE